MNRIVRLLAACILSWLGLNAQKPMVTIWIHGTMPSLIVPKFAKHSFFHLEHGLVPISQYHDTDQLYKIADALINTCPEQFNADHYYTFGWSGKLSFTERKKAAQELYQSIVSLNKSYQETHGQPPHIRVITHSHGGNVALSMAKVKQSDEPFIIDELVLLACPVQEKTKHLIAHDCFNRVYSLYSSGDIIQIIDPQGLYQNSKTDKLFSEHTFNHHEKLRQAQIEKNGKSLAHMDFLWTSFAQHLPSLLQSLDEFYTSVVHDQECTKVLDIHTSKHNGFTIHKKLAYT